MKVLLIGLGKMGGNMARRLLRAGHQVIGYDPKKEIIDQLAAEEGLIPAISVEDGISKLDFPSVVWLMVPSGKPTEETIMHAASLMKPGSVIVDGGNSNFNDSIRIREISGGEGYLFL